jgi:predicted GNAT family N-acyltransferase
MSVSVEQVPVWLVLPLRQRILRPHQRVAEAVFEGDTTGTHFAAFEPDSTIVGVASLLRESSEDEPYCWRLRGMAVDEARQQSGIGGAIISGVVDFVARNGGGLLWCNARLSAVGFYQRFGFVEVGEVFEEPIIGPHIQMERPVERFAGEATRD